MKIAHLKRTDEFRKVLSDGKKTRERTITVYSLRDEDAGLRIGTTITKRLAPKATQRNYIKRIIYGYFIDNGKKLKSGIRMVVQLNRDVRELKRKEISSILREELENITRTIG